ncbi:MAG TPA: alkaline phosphatase family protein [Solirubrobacteraceae bacterium]|nr:alkaline phosphatase family protein [Solirubrobacteraceae bacterium]
MGAARARQCGACGSPLAGDQRYCLVCGARAGARSPELLALLARIAVQARQPVSESVAAAAATATPASAVHAGVRVPPAKVSAALIVLLAAFGVLLGIAGGSHLDDTLAASSRGPVRLLLPAPTASATPETPVSAVAESPAERPAAETPAASPSTPVKSTATTPSSSEAGGGEAANGVAGEGSGSTSATKLPAFKHVFVIVLADEPYASAFGPASPAHYLAGTLERRGELLVRYDAVAHEELANEIALVSGQGPTTQTAANCPTYADVAPASTGAHEQVLGDGCVYPPATVTLAGQLSAAHRSWRAYVQGIDEQAGQPPACAHPPLGQPDPTASTPAAPGAASAGPYATFRNPFVYFHSLTDSSACAANDVGLDRLRSDLAAPARTPSLSYIVPDRCHDGNASPCATGAAAGMTAADALLRQLVPEITRSAAYREGGLLAITVDEAPSSGEFADSSSCCGAPAFPNLAAPAPGGPVGRGGGTVGALLLSPFIKGGATSQEPYNHFSLLRTIEDVFKLGHLGYAGLPAVKPLAPSLFLAKRRG